MGVMAGLGLFMIAPSMASSRFVLDGDHFESHQWFSPDQSVRFADLSGIDVSREVRHSRSGSYVQIDLLCVRRSGQSARVPAGDLMERVLGRVLQNARDRGVEVNDMERATDRGIASE
jgi:hypothetical protein